MSNSWLRLRGRRYISSGSPQRSYIFFRAEWQNAAPHYFSDGGSTAGNQRLPSLVPGARNHRARQRSRSQAPLGRKSFSNEFLAIVGVHGLTTRRSHEKPALDHERHSSAPSAALPAEHGIHFADDKSAPTPPYTGGRGYFRTKHRTVNSIATTKTMAIHA